LAVIGFSLAAGQYRPTMIAAVSDPFQGVAQMQNFIMLTRLISEEVNPTFNIRNKEMVLAEKIRQYCPEIEWVAKYAIMGPWIM